MKHFIVAPQKMSDFKTLKTIFVNFNVPFEEIDISLSLIGIDTEDSAHDDEDIKIANRMAKKIKTGKQKLYDWKDVKKELNLK